MNNKIQIKRIYERYEITSEGKVFSLIGNKKQLKPRIDTHGYYIIDICINKKRCTKRIHRLVAKAFIYNPNNYPQVNHIDGQHEIIKGKLDITVKNVMKK